MLSETKNCQNCKKDFTIEPEDFKFYEKIKVPPPTFCPECRSVRRLCFRNERTLYKNICKLCKKSIFSIYSPESEYSYCCSSCWNSEIDDPMQYGMKYDFSRPFFEQLRDLMLKVALPALKVSSSVNCDYNNNMSNSKDCYLSFRVHRSNNVLYTYRAKPSSYCVDCFSAFNSQYLYECIECTNCNNGEYLYFCANCANSKFLYNCRNCLDCFMCSNLRNKQYCFKNKQLTKEEYQNKMFEIDTNSFHKTLEYLKLFKEMKNKAIRRNLYIINSHNCIGDNLINCKNCYQCFDCAQVEDSRYVMEILTPSKEIMDSSSGGENELVYETTGSAKSTGVKFCYRPYQSRDVSYCFFVDYGKNLFGCVGLRHKENCILNYQYTKEEYNKLLPKILEHMNQMPYVDEAKRVYAYGEFFPFDLSPWSYNETVAQEVNPINREIASKKSYSWKEKNKRDYKITILASELLDNIKDVKDDIVNEVISCAHEGECYEDLEFCGADCTTAYRIIPAELQFYRRMNLPLPRLCPNCRHYNRLKEKNSNKLWRRKCECTGVESENGFYKNTGNHIHGKNECQTEFETSYAPNRPEIVYCEKCYQQEVY